MMIARTVVFSTTLPLLLMLKLDLASGQETCNSFFFCVNSTSFMVCVDNKPSGSIIKCDDRLFCCNDGLSPCEENFPCPTTTTQIPTTTELPSTTTQLPSTTTELPSTTTQLPSTTTELPSTTTELPSTTTELPSTTTQLPSTTIELPSTTTTSGMTTITTTTEKPFVCETSGRFPDPTNCTNYYMCSRMSNGSFYQYRYPCPGGSVFNPSTAKCTVDSTGNICRTASSSTSTSTTSTTPPSSSSTSTTTTTPPTPSSSSSTTTPPTPPSSSSTSSTTTTPPTPPSSSSSTSTTTTTAAPEFKCITSGRFPHPQDRTKYYLCSPDGNGDYYKYLYTCPSGSVFDPATAKCKISTFSL